MRTILLRSGLLLGLSALISACGSSDDTNGTSGGLVADCQKMCAATTPLKCPKTPPDCMMACSQETEAPPKCKAEFEAVIHCSAMHPTADWMCDTDGTATLKPGSGCDAETVKLISCLFMMP